MNLYWLEKIEKLNDYRFFVSSKPDQPTEILETDNAERILPDIEDNHEFESLLVRQRKASEHRESVITHDSHIRELAQELLSYGESSQSIKNVDHDTEIVKDRDNEEEEKIVDNKMAVDVDEEDEDDINILANEELPTDLSCGNRGSESEQLDRMLINIIEHELSNVGLASNKEQDLKDEVQIIEEKPPSPEVVELIQDDNNKVDETQKPEEKSKISIDVDSEDSCADSEEVIYKIDIWK